MYIYVYTLLRNPQQCLRNPRHCSGLSPKSQTLFSSISEILHTVRQSLRNPGHYSVQQRLRNPRRCSAVSPKSWTLFSSAFDISDTVQQRLRSPGHCSAVSPRSWGMPKVFCGTLEPPALNYEGARGSLKPTLQNKMIFGCCGTPSSKVLGGRGISRQTS